MSKKHPKILYIITKSVWGGAGKYVYDLATSLPSDWQVFVAGGGEGELAKKLSEKNVSYFNIKSFKRDVSVLKDLLAFFEILTLFFKTKPNIIHVSSPKAGGIAGLASFLYKLLTLKLSLVTIFTAHGWTFHEERPKWQLSLIKFFSKITCLFYNKIVCVSEFDRLSALKNKIAPEKKLITIHNGIKSEDYNFLPKAEAREKLITNYQLPVTDYWIGTIGEDTKNKGHEYLKKAIPNALIINDLPQGYNYLKAFDVFVLPSIKEGLPYILLEAGLARIPIIATSVGGVPEIIENNINGILVNPKNPEELKEAVEKLSENSTLQNDLSYALWEKVNREFSFEKMLNSTLMAYEKNSQSGKNSEPQNS